jgi:tape measure domain-containing protein
MNNTIEFVVKMKNMMSGELGKLSSTAQSSFHKMSQFAQGVGDKNKVLGMSYNELSKQIANVENTIKNSTIPSQIAFAKRELADLQKQAAKHQGNTTTTSNLSGVGIGTIAGGTMLGNLATTGLSMIGDGISAIITKSMEKETAIAGMSTFLGKQGATEAYKNIQTDANATPFDTASLLEVNRALISSGSNAKEARKDALNLGNAIVAVGGSGDTLTRMAANLQQIKTVGKATAMDIRQFGMAGINIYEMLSRSTGKSIDQVKNMDVTYADLSKAMAMAAGKGGMYENALLNAQNSTQGKWSNLKESVVNNLAAIGESFKPLINGIIDIGFSFSSIGNSVVQFANWINSSSTSASAFLIVVAMLSAAFVTYQLIIGGVALWTGIVTKAQLLWNLAMTANPIGILVVGLAALVAGIAVAYNKFEGFRAMIDGVWGVMKDIASLFTAIFTNNFAAIPTILKRIFTGESYTQAHDQSLLKSRVERYRENKAKATQLAKDKNAPISDATKLSNSNNESGKKAGDTVTGGGPKTINITVGKFFDNIQFTTMNGKESAQELENMVLECFSRVVYNGAKMV